MDRYIVSGEPAALRPLLDLLEANPETAIDTITRTERGDPERFVVFMDPTTAAALTAALRGNRILIEPDQLLDL